MEFKVTVFGTDGKRDGHLGTGWLQQTVEQECVCWEVHAQSLEGLQRMVNEGWSVEWQRARAWEERGRGTREWRLL